MTAPSGYARASLTMLADRTVTGEIAAELVGVRLTAVVDGVTLSSGVITDARPGGDDRVTLIVESQGRRCPACGIVYSEERAKEAMLPLGQLRGLWRGEPGGLEATIQLPGWVQVCTAWASCERRRADSR